MPLLLFLACAALLLRAARHAFGSPSTPAAGALIAIALVLPGFALATGRVLAPLDAYFRFAPLSGLPAAERPRDVSAGILSDVQTQILPWRAAVRFAFDQGEWPLWNPFIQGGDPLAGSAQAAPYFPTQLLSLVLPVEDGPAFVAACLLLSAALGVFLLARDLGCREPAALVAAAGWTLSGFLMFWLPWSLAQAVALTPLVILATRRLIGRPGLGRALQLAVVLTLLLLTGHPESMLHVATVGAIWGLTELATRRARRAELLRTSGWALGAGVLALGLASFSLLPFVDALLQSTEHYLRGEVFVGARRDLPLGQALRLLVASFVPFVHGVPGRELGEASERFSLPASGYVASVLLLPALTGLRAPGRPLRRLLGGLALFGLAAGSALPPVLDLMAKLPLFTLALNERLIFLVPLALALLAAYGVDSWQDDAEARGLTAARPSGRTALVWVGGMALFLAALWPSMRANGLSVGFLVERSAWWLLPPLALTVALLSRVPTRVLAAGLVMLVAAQRQGELGHLHRSFERNFYAPRVAPLDLLPDDEEPYRIVALGSTLLPNSAALWHLEDIRGDQALTLRRLVETRRLLGRANDIARLLIDSLDSRFLDFLNVRFALVPEGWAPIAGWPELAKANGVRLLENPRVLPRAFLPPTVRVGSDPWRLGAELAAATRFGQRAWIEPWDPGARPVPRTQRNGHGEVRIRRAGLGYRLTTRLDRASWITVSVPAWRGWRAVADGGELPLAFANHAFLGVRVPEGARVIELFYRPRSFDLGLAISAASLALLMVMVAASVHRRRGKPASANR